MDSCLKDHTIKILSSLVPKGRTHMRIIQFNLKSHWDYIERTDIYDSSVSIDPIGPTLVVLN